MTLENIKHKRVALCGYAGHGKNSAAFPLIQAGFREDSFAKDLKNMAYAINPYVKTIKSKTTSGCPAEYQFLKLQELIRRVGIEEAKQHQDVREFYQRFGTECIRDYIADDFWVNRVFDRICQDSETPVVITDARFSNEGTMLKELGFFFIWIHRPGIKRINSHSSENGYMEKFCSVTVVNDGTEENLHDAIKGLTLTAFP